MCLQQVLAGVMHNDSSSSLSVGITDTKRCLRTDPHSKLIRSCGSNGVAWREVCFSGVSTMFFLASGSCRGLTMFWVVFGPALVLAAGGFSSDGRCCDNRCLSAALQAVLSVLGSAPLGASMVSSVWAASRPPGGCAEEVEVFIASYRRLWRCWTSPHQPLNCPLGWVTQLLVQALSEVIPALRTGGFRVCITCVMGQGFVVEVKWKLRFKRESVQDGVGSMTSCVDLSLE